MIKYFCDRCGDEIGDYKNEIFTITVTSPPMTASWAKDAETGTYILCYDCVKELNMFIKRNAK